MSLVVPKYGFIPSRIRASICGELGPAVVDHLARAGLAHARRAGRWVQGSEGSVRSGPRWASGIWGRRERAADGGTDAPALPNGPRKA